MTPTPANTDLRLRDAHPLGAVVTPSSASEAARPITGAVRGRAEPGPVAATRSAALPAPLGGPSPSSVAATASVRPGLRSWRAPVTPLGGRSRHLAPHGHAGCVPAASPVPQPRRRGRTAAERLLRGHAAMPPPQLGLAEAPRAAAVTSSAPPSTARAFCAPAATSLRRSLAAAVPAARAGRVS